MTTKNKISKIFTRYIIDVNTKTYEDGWRESQIVLNIQFRLNRLPAVVPKMEHHLNFHFVIRQAKYMI